MKVIDFHSHLLPQIDDGARDINTSLQILEMAANQGVECMVATPHFYPWEDNIENFIKNRQNAYKNLVSHKDYNGLKIVLGAEVAAFPGIGKAEHIDLLCIEETHNILIEMPFDLWTDSDINDIKELCNRGLHVIIAHLERYMNIKGNRTYINKLLELPVSIQVNAEGLMDWKQRGKLLKMLKNGQVHILGSDCHGVHHRVPNLGAARQVISKKLGMEVLNTIDRNGQYLLENKNG